MLTRLQDLSKDLKDSRRFVLAVVFTALLLDNFLVTVVGKWWIFYECICMYLYMVSFWLCNHWQGGLYFVLSIIVWLLIQMCYSKAITVVMLDKINLSFTAYLT